MSPKESALAIHAILLTLLAGALGGFLAGFLGVGGGIVIVPALVEWLKLSEHQAHGTSLAIIGPLALAGTFGYAFHGNFNFGLAATLAAGGIFGSILGARLMMRVAARRLRQLFGVVLLIVAVRQIFFPSS